MNGLSAIWYLEETHSLLEVERYSVRYTKEKQQFDEVNEVMEIKCRTLYLVFSSLMKEIKEIQRIVKEISESPPSSLDSDPVLVEIHYRYAIALRTLLGDER